MLEFNERNIKTWAMTGPSGALGMATLDIAGENKDFAVVTSDLCYFSGLDKLKNKYPEKLINVGIAEQNMINVAAGMAKEGMSVFATTYATFAALRALDQVKVSMGYMKLPVKLIGLTSGFSVGILGATHMSVEDIAVMRTIPNLVIFSPADCTETVKCLYEAQKLDLPVYIRMGGGQRTPVIYDKDYEFIAGKAIALQKGEDILIIATGAMVNEALKTAKLLEEKQFTCTVLDMHTIKPIDKEAILEGVKYKLIISIEEHSIIGGLGSAIAETLALTEQKPRHLIVGVEDQYPHAAGYEYLKEKNGLTAPQICRRALQCLNHDL